MKVSAIVRSSIESYSPNKLHKSPEGIKSKARITPRSLEIFTLFKDEIFIFDLSPYFLTIIFKAISFISKSYL